MKKFITFSIICILSGIALSSCKSGVSITKRHYTKGYHIARNHNLKAPKPTTNLAQQTREGIEKVNVPNQLMVLEKNNEQKIQNFSNKSMPDNTLMAAKVIASIKSKINPKENINFFVIPKIKLIENTSTFTDKSKIGSAKITKADHTHEGLSLFWIVILVLLILWALGLLGGYVFGGLIYLLLVVALILLILWLLRIV